MHNIHIQSRAAYLGIRSSFIKMYKKVEKEREREQSRARVRVTEEGREGERPRGLFLLPVFLSPIWISICLGSLRVCHVAVAVAVIDVVPIVRVRSKFTDLELRNNCCFCVYPKMRPAYTHTHTCICIYSYAYICNMYLYVARMFHTLPYNHCINTNLFICTHSTVPNPQRSKLCFSAPFSTR